MFLVTIIIYFEKSLNYKKKLLQNLQKSIKSFIWIFLDKKYNNQTTQLETSVNMNESRFSYACNLLLFD
jgi:hypothetical protein